MVTSDNRTLAPLNELESGICLAYNHKLDLYNLTSDGQDNRRSDINSFNHSDETKNKLSIFNKGKLISLETRQKMSLAKIGTTRSVEARIKQGQSTRGSLHFSFGRPLRPNIILGRNKYFYSPIKL